jgi:hypothetical protein
MDKIEQIALGAMTREPGQQPGESASQYARRIAVAAMRVQAGAPIPPGVSALPARWRKCKRGLSALGCANELELALTAAQQPAAVDGARPLDEWHEDDGPVVWWKFPVDEPAWIGTPLDSDWPGYHTHWTPHPEVPALAQQPKQPESR